MFALKFFFIFLLPYYLCLSIFSLVLVIQSAHFVRLLWWTTGMEVESGRLNTFSCFCFGFFEFSFLFLYFAFIYVFQAYCWYYFYWQIFKLGVFHDSNITCLLGGGGLCETGVSIFLSRKCNLKLF